MSATHAANVVVNVYLQDLAPQRAGFGKVLVIVDEDDSGGANSLNGNRTAEYADETEVAAAETAGYISADTAAFLEAVFAQVPKPDGVLVGKVQSDAPESESLAAGYAAIRADNSDYYGVCCPYTRADADVVALSDAIETEGDRLFFFTTQSADALTAGLPSGISSISDNDRTVGVYHDEATEPADVAWAAARLVFDPDEQSADWEGRVRGVAALTSGITTTERGLLLDNNLNVGLPYSSASYFMSPGNTIAGKGIYEVVSADWFRARVSEDVAALKLLKTSRGEKITVDEAGQNDIMAILEARLAEGEEKSHFTVGETRATAYTITDDDRTNRQLRFKVEAQIAGSAYSFTFNVYTQRTALAEA